MVEEKDNGLASCNIEGERQREKRERKKEKKIKTERKTLCVCLCMYVCMCAFDMLYCCLVWFGLEYLDSICLILTVLLEGCSCAVRETRVL